MSHLVRHWTSPSTEDQPMQFCRTNTFARPFPDFQVFQTGGHHVSNVATRWRTSDASVGIPCFVCSES